ncbi:VWA domain-containing protein [Moritella sp. Urea-trap-13]|uniref:VWA domain-containing protein n=1 Tax=Moritella sp. Urea-trap-13 TaxID=2058327 RepID=UPI000C32BB04|nr:VWA domain-containing protein [Moritella sp. Urea-trap-13]PKH04892.1 aerotolerance regulator BatA [Moritella sp. Urea-trap-13]
MIATSMIEFSYPWLFLLLPLPWFIQRFSPAYKIKQSALQVPFFSQLVSLSGEQPNTGAVKLEPKMWQRIALSLVWLFLVIAMAKPMWLGEPQIRSQFGRDLMVVVDLSGSMDSRDFSVPGRDSISRLTAVKNVLTEFSQQRSGDRLGLILFGDAAYLQAPFTADHQAWLGLLNDSEVAMAGQSTHLGDALGLAIKVMTDESIKAPISKENSNASVDKSTAEKSTADKQKVVIVLTDGNDTDSLVPPLEAAKIAASRGIKIHMIAIGDPRTFGEQALDMAVIDSVADITGGQAFQAISSVELNRVYAEISTLEPSQFSSFSYQPKVSVHYALIALAVSIYFILYSLVIWRSYYLSKQQSKRDLLLNKRGED